MGGNLASTGLGGCLLTCAMVLITTRPLPPLGLLLLKPG